MVGIRLETDYLDYWDQEVALFQNLEEALTFQRRRYPPMSIQEQFNLLAQIDLSPPLSGTAKEIAESGANTCSTQVLIYANPLGAMSTIAKLPLEDAIAYYPDHFCVQFLESAQGIVQHIQIGNRAWILKTEFSKAIASPSLTLLGETEPFYHPLLQKFPIFSVELVPLENMRAVAFSSTPLLQGTGIDKILPPRLCFRLVQAHLVKLNTASATATVS